MDALVIGAGVDELVCAHHLARAGLRVLVLETRAAPEPLAAEGWVPPRVIRGLDIESRSLEIECPDPWLTVPLPDGGVLELRRDMARSVEAIGRVSSRDAANWPAFCGRVARLARLLESLYVSPPPDPVARGIGGLARLAALGARMRWLGRQGVEDLLRLAPLPVADLLDDWFETDALKGALGAAGVAHLAQGPRAGGTAFRLLHHHAGSPPGVFRPPRSNLARVLAAAPGIELRRAAAPARIDARAGRAAAVVLADGEEILARLFVSGLDPRATLLELADPGWLDPELVRALRHVRRRGASARVILSLERPPGFSRLAVAPSLAFLERAHDDAKYGRISREPLVEAVSAGADADGRYRLEAHVQYAPYALADGGWDEERRRSLGDLVLRALSPHLRACGGVAVTRVLTPRDLEDAYGWPEGQAHHAELALDQALWMRPTPALAHYRTPIAGLYLCGPGMHPGGGIPGAAGYNAAREIVSDLRRGRLN